MPTYDYQCRACGTVTEVIHSMLEGGPTACERCGGELRRVLYPTGIIFKGSGFYRTDSRSSASTGGKASGKASSAGSSGSEAASGGDDKAAPAADGATPAAKSGAETQTARDDS